MLAVNTAVHTSDHIDVWLDSTKKGERSRFLKPRFSVNATGQSVTALRDEAAFVPPGDVVYELKVDMSILSWRSLLKLSLQAMVVQIQTEDDAPHLVSLVKGKPVT